MPTCDKCGNEVTYVRVEKYRAPTLVSYKCNVCGYEKTWQETLPIKITKEKPSWL